MLAQCIIAGNGPHLSSCGIGLLDDLIENQLAYIEFNNIGDPAHMEVSNNEGLVGMRRRVVVHLARRCVSYRVM